MDNKLSKKEIKDFIENDFLLKNIIKDNIDVILKKILRKEVYVIDKCINSKKINCPICKGSGKIYIKEDNLNENYTSIDCYECEGGGFIFKRYNDYKIIKGTIYQLLITPDDDGINYEFGVDNDGYNFYADPELTFLSKKDAEDKLKELKR